MKWGLFGGTFDPVHFGHLRAALELAGMLRLDRVVFIPAARPPHKTQRVIASFEQRAQMVRLAIAGNERFSFSDAENQRPGKSYSIDTVRFFSESQGNPQVYFITGQDAFDAITTWYQWEKLLQLCHFAVMTRPGYENRGVNRILPPELASRYVYDEKNDLFSNDAGKCVLFRRTTFLDISSSGIREHLLQGRDVRYLLPDAVIRYIRENRLYGSQLGR
jgi:nicotinate-nucleotide adenylyltransferase